MGGIGFWQGGNKNLVVGESTESTGGGDEQIFGWLGDSPPHANPSRVNPVFSVKMSKNTKKMKL